MLAGSNNSTDVPYKFIGFGRGDYVRRVANKDGGKLLGDIALDATPLLTDD